MNRRLLAVLGVAAALLIAGPAAEAMTAKTRTATLDRLADLIADHYVYKDKAAAIAAEVRTWKADAEIARQTDEVRFSALLTERLRKKDRHFSVTWQRAARHPAAAAAADEAENERRSNYGFDEVKRLPGNIGYIRMSYFSDFDTSLTGDQAPGARRAGEAALALLANSDTVIFDLRRNNGGSPAMIDLLLSAFFGGEPVLLNRFYRRSGERMEEYFTLANYTGARRPDVPVYVLISEGTASAAEEFAYDVQSRKRGVLLGEATYGGANPGDSFDAGHGFSAFISTGAAVNPVTGTNWEGTGVQPDVAVPAADALARAYVLALRQALALAKPGADIGEVRWSLEQAEAEAAPPVPAALQDYVGHYEGRDISLKDGALVYSCGRFPVQKLIPLAQDTFGIADMPVMRLRFKRDAAGQVVSLTVVTVYGSGRTFSRGADR